MTDLINVRKDSFGEWDPYEITGESHTIPSSSPYTLSLDEVPSDGLIEGVETTPPEISGFSEVTTELALAVDTFFVNYDTGMLTFHADNAGETISVDYWGLGSLIVADHINELRDRIIVGNAEPDEEDIDYEAGTLWTYDDRVWICLKNTDPAFWMEWGGDKIFKINEATNTESSIEFDEDCGISFYVNKPLNTPTPENYLAMQILCTGQVYIPNLYTGES